MEITEVAPDTFLVTGPFDGVRRIADRLGLQMTLIDEPDFGNRPRMFTIYVERPESVGGWSMAKTKIAFGSDLRVVIQKAVTALREMAPRLQKKLDELDPAHESVGPVYGVGSDGTITALRVERDGSVRLAPEDLEAIVDRTNRALAGVERLAHEIAASARLTDSWAANAHVMLERLQWTEMVAPGHCSVCAGFQPNHEPGCALAALLDV